MLKIPAYQFFVNWFKEYMTNKRYIYQSDKSVVIELFLDKSKKTQKLYSYKKNIPTEIMDIAFQNNLLLMLPNKEMDSIFILKSDNKKYFMFQKCLVKYMNESYPEKGKRWNAYFLDEWYFTNMLVSDGHIKYKNENKTFIQTFIKIYFEKFGSEWKWKYTHLE